MDKIQTLLTVYIFHKFKQLSLSSQRVSLLLIKGEKLLNTIEDI